MAAAAILNFGKNVNSGLDTYIYTKFYEKKHHGHATRPKVETGS